MGLRFSDTEAHSQGFGYAKAKSDPVTIGYMATKTGKALDHETNERVRAFVRAVADRDFEGNKSALARAFDMTPSIIGELLGGSRGAGMKLLTAASTHTGVSIDDITRLGAEALPPAGTRSSGAGAPGEVSTVREGAVRFGDSEQWRAASAEARRVHGRRIPLVAFDLADDFRGFALPTVIDARTVLNYARAAWEGMNDEEQSAALAAQAESEMADEDRRVLDELPIKGLRDELTEARAEQPPRPPPTANDSGPRKR